MVKKKEINEITKIKKDLKEKEVIIGSEKVVKDLRLGNIKRIYITKNCKKEVKEEIVYLSSEQKEVEIVQLPFTNKELGDVCKKPFMISVLGIR